MTRTRILLIAGGLAALAVLGWLRSMAAAALYDDAISRLVASVPPEQRTVLVAQLDSERARSGR